MTKKPNHKKSIIPPKLSPVKKPFETRPQGATYAVDYTDKSLDTHIDAYKKAAPSDDYILTALVGVYEEALASLKLEGPKHAVHFFWEEVKEYANNKRLTDAELKILYKAKEGDLRAIQTLVKANSRMLLLPFVQETMIALLREQKYSTQKNGADLKDKWADFLHKRAKGKILFDNNTFESLVDLGSRYERRSEAIKKVAVSMTISEDYVKDAIKVQGTRGRRKKGE